MFAGLLAGSTAMAQIPTVAVYLSDSPLGGAATNYVVYEGGVSGYDTTYLVFQYFPPGAIFPIPVDYSLGGSASSSDYSPTLSGSVSIPVGTNLVAIPIHALLDSTVESMQTLGIALTPKPAYYNMYPGYTNCTVQIYDDTPRVETFFQSVSVMEGQSANLIIQRTNAYSISAACTVGYTLSGTAVSGKDYTGLSGSATILQGQNYVSIPVSTILKTTNIATRLLTVTLNSGTYSIITGQNTTSLGILHDTPTITVTAPFSGAFQNGSSGQFTIARSGGLASSVTANFAISGTATSGVNYTALPSSVTFAANQTTTNLYVNPTSSPTLTSAQTVVLTLSSNTAYAVGANSQAVVTLLPNSSATNSVASPVGRYKRGSGSNPAFWSIVVPLDFESGIPYDNLYGNALNLYGIVSWSSSFFYHYNATNALPQTNTANRIAFNNPIVGFGERIGGTPVYLNQPYSFGVYAGDLLPVGQPVSVLVYARSNLALVGTINLNPPDFSNTNSWNSYVTNGFTVTTNAFGLATTLASTPTLSWGAESLGQNLPGAYILTHTASSAATNYYYLVQSYGYLDNQGAPMALASGGFIAPSLLYTLEFSQRPQWRSVFIDAPHFDGIPLPPFYADKTLSEMLTNTPPVTNSISLSPLACTNLDNSPELRRHPILDQFVSDMGNDPVALANYVLNQIDLTDAMDYNDNGAVSEQSVNIGGVSRGALGTFLEKEGSPTEQCALLIYLLRQAGVPATFVYPPHNGLKILDARLSRLLKFQVHGAFSEAGQRFTTNTMIAVNYPWVAAYIGTNWVHIFPWLKDYEVTEGLDMYDYMPTNYSSAYPWVRDYVFGNTNLLSLAVNGDNTPRVIFPKFLQQTLRQNYPGVSVDDLGVKISNRQHYYSRWQDFPTPTWLTNSSTAVPSLTDSSITSVNPAMTNIFDTLSIEIYSTTDPTKDIQTGDMRLSDLHNRQFYITQTNLNSTQVKLSLILSAYRTNITTQFSYGSTDTNLLSKQVLSLTLDQFDDQLNVRFKYNRHRALTPSFAVDSTQPAFGLSVTRQLVFERPLRKGDVAAICMSYGQVTRDMVNVHAQTLWQMQNAVRATPSLTNSLSSDLYQGATMFTAGMEYYRRVSDFDGVNRNLHKVNVLSSWAAGLSKISPHRDSLGSLASGAVDPILPNVDMFFYETAWMGNGTLRPDSGRTQEATGQNYNLIGIADVSAEEHQAINQFYQQTNAVSTVRLLQLAQSRGQGIVTLNINNYVAQGQAVYQGKALSAHDTGLWQQVVSAFQTSDGSYITAYMTPGPVTNAAYTGMGALVLGWGKWQALITPDSINGAFGEYFPYFSVSSQNTWNWDYSNNGQNISVNVVNSNDKMLLPSLTTSYNSQFQYNQILNSSFGYDPFSLNSASSFQNLFGLGNAGSQNQTIATDYRNIWQSGNLQPDDGGSQWMSKVLDPVHSVTGEFYVDETDLQLPGPIPLALRRNYSSQNLADNQFGYGWKLSLMPYLCVSKGTTNIYAADMDGAVLTYVHSTSNTNLWTPTPAANPQLNNNTTAGAGGLVNRLRDSIVKSVNGSVTNYTLNGADGSVRLFQWMIFNNGILTNSRPYLQQWTDNRGNSYSFSYGTNKTQTDFGQVRRIQCSNGNFLGLYYDVYGHIIEAYCGDGRRMKYDYDEFGDLITVTLPDESTRSYVYQHSTQAVTNGAVVTQQPYSMHLIVEEDKPDGRVLQNIYDSQRRVTNQLSTAGLDLTPVRTASFVYSNNFNYTNSFTNTVTGYTLIIDGKGSTNRYEYTNSLITKITDPLGQTIQQSWYADNATAPGYPRSVQTRTDKRNLFTQYFYDSNGNVTNSITTGDLTGDGITSQTATNSATYNTNNLPLQIIDAVGNSTVYLYDTSFTFLPQQTIRYAGATPVSTNYQIYGSVTNIVTLGAITQTNRAYGLMTRKILAFNSTDAATNDLAYDGHGFITQSVRFTGTTDPAITNTFFYNERGQVVSQMDALGAVTFSDYDALDRLTERDNFDENGNLLSWNFNYYNDNGELVWSDGPRYNPEDYVWRDYDGDGRLATEIHWRSEAKSDGTGVEAPSGYNLYAQSFYQYDVLGNLTRSVDPRGAITTNSWDVLGRLTKRQHLDTDGLTLLGSETFGYEAGGQVRFFTNALGGFVQTDYTTTGQPEFRRNADGSTNGWRYYFDGRSYREIQANGAYWQTTYDDANRTSTRVFYSSTGTPQATNSTQVDRRGNVIRRTDEAGNVFTNTYDDIDRIKIAAGPAIATVIQDCGFIPNCGVYVTNVLQQVTTSFYDAAGRVVTNINALAEKSITRSDAIGRLVRTEVRNAAGTLLRESSVAYSADHNSITVTNGSGTNAIISTTYTDNDGRTLLTAGYPAAGILDYTWKDYDLAGNLDYEEHDVSFYGSVSGYTSATYSHDGLNRMTRKVDRDSAVTTYAYNSLGGVTNRVMPGSNLMWSATYNNAGQMLQEWNTGGSLNTRTNTYSYFTAGNPFAGLLQSKTDGRGVNSTYAYDIWLRAITNTCTGSLPEQNLTTVFQYEPRGFVTSITEQFATNTTGPMTVVTRAYNPYGQLSSESVSGGSFNYSTSQTWDAAGRRSALNFGALASYGYAWRADGLLASASAPYSGGSYNYNTAGLLTSRDVGVRSTAIASRDGEGHPYSINTTVNGVSQLTESLGWFGDGLLATHTLTRVGDFTDSRSYSYANSSRRLTQEQLNLNGSTRWTNNLAYDGGTSSGPGALTSVGQTSALWRGAADSFSRVATETNNNFFYASYGHANGPATFSAWLDNQPTPVTAVGTQAIQWRATMEMGAGNHQLRVAAVHPSGQYTAWATNSFTNSIAFQTTADTFDGAGNITVRVWKNPNGTTNHTQNLSWDARGRLYQVVERDFNNSGYNWTATYDGLNRRLSTTAILVTNGVALSSQPKTINQYYDPLVEFLELGISSGGQTVWKLYGPDLNGKYGAMNGTGGFEGVSLGFGTFYPTISDARGNILGQVINGVVSWSSSRTTGYGAVAGYRPLALANASDISLSSAWRGRWVDITGYHQLGLRPYDSISGRWLTYDSVWNERDPNYYTFCGGDPINGFDADGRVLLQQWQQSQQNLITRGGFWNNTAAYGISLGITAFNAFSIGSFGKNDALVDRNLSGEISDGQLYGGMAINTGVAALSVGAGYGAGALATRGFGAGVSTLMSHVAVGSASGLAASTTDVLATRGGYNLAGIGYQQTIGQDLTQIATGTALGGVMGGTVYGIQNSPLALTGVSPNTVLSGHGDIQPGNVTVPNGTSLRVFAADGSPISDRLGNAIETGQNLSGVYSKTYGPGETAPNYTLYPPDMPGTAPINIVGNPTTVGSATSVGQLLSPNMGTVDWAACAGNYGTLFNYNGYGLSSAIGSGAAGTSSSLKLGNCGK